jgi:Flp pilus assembly pilin Flp
MRNLLLKAYSRRMAREEGQTVIEYALVVALVSIVLAAALVGFGNDIIDAAQTAVEGVL